MEQPVKLKHSRFQVFLEVVAAALLAGMCIYFAIAWQSAPEQIPMHYNAAGEIDRWSGKGELLFLPIVAAALYVFLTLISRFPAAWNMPGAVTEENRQRMYSAMLTLLIALKAEVSGIFWCLAAASLSGSPLPPAFLPIMIAVLAATLISCILAARSKKG